MKIALLAGVLLVLFGTFVFFADYDPAEDVVIEDTSTDEVSDQRTDAQEEEGSLETDDDEQVATGEDRVFTLDSFMFGYSEEEIIVDEGDTVTINLTSSEGRHDWVVDEFSAATEVINPGQETSVTFVADQTGQFEFYCSVGNHRAQGMVGTLIVQ